MCGFKNVKKNFVFGCMRLPMKDGKIDYTEFSEMVGIFMAEGFNYFDTARVYHVILYVPDIRRKR